MSITFRRAMTDSAGEIQDSRVAAARPGRGGQGRGRPKAPLPPTGQRHPFDLCGEVEDNLGIVLWKRARAVKLWAGTRPERRPGLFVEPGPHSAEQLVRALEQAPELGEPLGVLMALVRSPEEARRADVAAACLQVAEWADRGGNLETALQFAEAAATAHPRSAEAAAMAGHFCTRVAAVDRAVVWLQRAIVLARRALDRVWYIRSHLRLGFLMFHLGDYEQARKLYLLASRMAARTGRRALAGQAQHDLFTVACEVGTFEEAQDHAWKSLDLYPVRHRSVPYLAHDYAWLLNRECHFSSALVVLRATLPLISTYRRITITGSLARACAGVGDRAGYEAAAAEVVRLAATTEEGAAAAFTHVAEGARCFREWEAADTYARRALDLAVRREEAEPHRLAAALLARIAAREPGPLDRQPADDGRVRELTGRFLARLKKWSAPAVETGADT